MYQTDKQMFISFRAFLEQPPGIRRACVNRGTDCGTSLGKLTVRRVETAKGPARLLDQHGLYLRGSPKGAKMWIQRLTIRGRRADNGIGHYPAMGLAEARAAAFERWKIAKAGGDPRVAGGTPAGPTFRDAAELSDGSGLVFPGMRPGRPLSENTHAKLLRELGFDAVTHGFRSSFRDYAAEQTHTPHAVMEAALAHVVRNKAEAAYARSAPFEKRRTLMESGRNTSPSDGAAIGRTGLPTRRPGR